MLMATMVIVMVVAPSGGNGDGCEDIGGGCGGGDTNGGGGSNVSGDGDVSGDNSGGSNADGCGGGNRLWQ